LDIVKYCQKQAAELTVVQEFQKTMSTRRLSTDHTGNFQINAPTVINTFGSFSESTANTSSVPREESNQDPELVHKQASSHPPLAGKDGLLNKAVQQSKKNRTDQGKSNKPDQGKSNEADQGKGKVPKMKEDYARIIDTLRDPPDGDFALIRAWSETDDLYRTPLPEETKQLQPLAKQFDATIVDFYRLKDAHGDTRVNFLRRTRSVRDVVYDEPKKKSSDERKGGNADESDNCGPNKIMEDARSKAQETTGLNPWGAKQNVYSDEALQFRWLHLPANNVSKARQSVVWKWVQLTTSQ